MLRFVLDSPHPWLRNWRYLTISPDPCGNSDVSCWPTFAMCMERCHRCRTVLVPLGSTEGTAHDPRTRVWLLIISGGGLMFKTGHLLGCPSVAPTLLTKCSSSSDHDGVKYLCLSLPLSPKKFFFESFFFSLRGIQCK